MIKLISGDEERKDDASSRSYLFLQWSSDARRAIDGTLMKSSVLWSSLYCHFNLNEGDLKWRLCLFRTQSSDYIASVSKVEVAGVENDKLIKRSQWKSD